jgi:hypothetical protein
MSQKTYSTTGLLCESAESDRRVGVLENLRFLVCHLNSKFVRVAGLIPRNFALSVLPIPLVSWKFNMISQRVAR